MSTMAKGYSAPPGGGSAAAGTAEQVAEGVLALTAPNPSPMTHTGTRTYILGDARLTVVDPGPDDPAHLARIDAAAAGRPVERVVVTHAHLDHSPLAARFAARGAEIVGRRWDAGRSALMGRLARDLPELGGGEGVDRGFAPDREPADGETIPCEGGDLRVLHTPGHMASHLALDRGDALLVGDTVMGWASTLISPPDGDLTQFLETLDRLESLGRRRLLPGHGDAVEDGTERIRGLRAHRLAREVAILDALGEPARIEDLLPKVYADADRCLWPAAARNLLAHLLRAAEAGFVRADPAPHLAATWTRLV
jgi:glyoxylase-like metal-dependent hydrolase (beta-lactamase superfamily II)